MPHPPIDEHLVEPGTRQEMLRGELIYAAPALPPHADRHFELDYLIRAHIAPNYIGSSDLLTRVNTGSNFATDVAVRKRGIDPETGGRYLEELAFEVVSTQSLREMIIRAEDLSARGVRRLLAIFVNRRSKSERPAGPPAERAGREAAGFGLKRNEVCEWSVVEHRFVPLSLDDQLEDPTLARPLPIRALLDAAVADDAVVDALDAKGNRRLRAIKARELDKGMSQGMSKGMSKGMIKGIESLCRILDIELTPERLAHLESLDTAGLERLMAQLETQRGWS